jgi:hypothetical protein
LSLHLQLKLPRLQPSGGYSCSSALRHVLIVANIAIMAHENQLEQQALKAL